MLLSCCQQHPPSRSGGQSSETVAFVTTLVSPVSGTIIQCGDSVKISLASLATLHVIDSVQLFSGKNHATTVYANPDKLFWNSRNSRVGQIVLKVRVFYDDSLSETHTAGVVVLSDIVPADITYRVIRQYPHDADAYTQGLFYDNGNLYESTGLEGKSSLRIVNIANGKPHKMVSLPGEFFGEGIALMKNQVYQITYKSQVGFVYDKNSLAQIRSFDYQIKEGWGLTTDNKNLIMSDGSAQLYFIEPEYFTQVDKIEVFNNKGMIDSLNELEYFNGHILANVYGQSFIVVIDTATGKVTGIINLHELIPEGSEGDYGKVLNGIAYNPLTGHLYVTGKHWPVLYEIELSPSL